ncbi:MAG: AraC family transcriptional regulator [Spirochaetia bacterium]|nr:AraC family transcriptional regulator [Spirochaetia bacterium]
MKRASPPKNDIRTSLLFESLFNAIRLRLLFHGRIKGKRQWFEKTPSPINRLYFFLKGRASVFEGEKEHPLRPGVVYLFPLGHPYRFEGNAGFEKWFFDFRAEIFPGWDLFEKTPPGQSFLMNVDPAARRLLACLEGSRLENLVEATGLLWQCLSRFVNLDKKDFLEKSSLGEGYALLRAIVANASFAEIRIGRIAAGMGMRASVLSKRFRADTGLTLERFIAHEFVERAKNELLLTELRVREIAGSLGFNSEFYFSRFFRKHTGMSPREYRKRHSWVRT